jgi:hypothetical protein
MPNMPVANCFYKKGKLSIKKMENMVNEWANIVRVDKKDICVNMIKEYSQPGQKYPVLANLYLPTLWSANDIKRIQLGLLKLLSKYLEVKENQIFIMTSLIQSEHVVENRQIVNGDIQSKIRDCGLRNARRNGHGEENAYPWVRREFKKAILQQGYLSCSF